MEEYRIVPWDQDPSVPIGLDREFYIPPEVEAIAQEVIARYEMTVSEMTLITSKPDKGGAIWRLGTDKGPRSLKVLHREPRRSLFSVYAQQWLVEQGARVPALIETKDGSLYVEAGRKLWIVTDWIPLEPASKMDAEGAETLVYGLGEFHRASRGYVPPSFAQSSARLYHWPKHYGKMIEKIGWFRDLARAYPETSGSSRLLEVVDRFETQAREALAEFEKSSFRKMVAKGEQHWGLVHQDFGFSNGQMGPDGIWVIDLDGVSFDFPIRDLRKLISSTMDDMGVWDADLIRRLIQAYHRANPLDRETYELLLDDMAFPNEFYKHIKEMIFDPELFLNTELDPILTRVLAAEESKALALSELRLDVPLYEPGEYEDVVERKFALPKFVRTPAEPLSADMAAPLSEDIAEPLSPEDAESAIEAPSTVDAFAVSEAEQPAAVAKDLPFEHSGVAVPAIPPQAPHFAASAETRAPSANVPRSTARKRTRKGKTRRRINKTKSAGRTRKLKRPLGRRKARRPSIVRAKQTVTKRRKTSVRRLPRAVKRKIGKSNRGTTKRARSGVRKRKENSG